jgi:ribose transport system ATP-binding protein
VSSLVLQVNDLAKRYGATVALEDVSFTLNAGEVCGLLGENGAGKSTLVKALSGVVTPDQGEIRLKGDLFWPTSVVDANRLGVSTVFQELSLVPSLSVATNLALPAPARNAVGLVSGREMRRRAEATLARWGGSDIRPSDAVGALPLGTRSAWQGNRSR